MKILNMNQLLRICKGFFPWLVEHREYAQIYSCVVATVALLFSICSFVISNIISKNRVKKDRQIEESKYQEQNNRYEKQLQDEKKRREEDKYEVEERNRILEQPYLVFKRSKDISSPQSPWIVIRMEFINKGRGSAYDIIPDMECVATTIDRKQIRLRRYDAVQDPIAMVGEVFIMEWCFECNQKYNFQMSTSIKLSDASGRRYIQTYNMDVFALDGSAVIKNYAQPQLCAE